MTIRPWTVLIQLAAKDRNTIKVKKKDINPSAKEQAEWARELRRENRRIKRWKEKHPNWGKKR